MAVVHKSVLLPFSAEQMFVLVNGIEEYPKFLPWCGGTEILRREENKVVASIAINYHGVKHSFTTENVNLPSSTIRMTLVEGPFRHLDGTWTFKPLRADACKVELDLHYEFASKLLDKMIGPVFHMIANNMVEAFCQRAEAVYV
ncbi:type II toxin-antitoxin system RatA family toxin [Noviherbaspirillum sedimenti]|uniref:Type II toxin-antitoxin system RatA family toxin n=1 Tax=Noviherbaspirillum sedimenti TaxID=2320865 RepID=A0A3A3G229_9BURK|nr:type II toxin-antitoxin system RatA family toxin [Noviherbaspirillum sedimenti]RJG00879.1 type II toxin-antitoxin system RatA family toxin [Noviherbaspirillum sedimenti]